MKNNTFNLKLGALSAVVLSLTSQSHAAESTAAPVQKTVDSQIVQTLPTLTIQATAAPKDPDISAVAKTVVTREEMEKYGDQSVSDALRRATGF